MGTLTRVATTVDLPRSGKKVRRSVTPKFNDRMAEMLLDPRALEKFLRTFNELWTRLQSEIDRYNTQKSTDTLGLPNPEHYMTEVAAELRHHSIADRVDYMGYLVSLADCFRYMLAGGRSSLSVRAGLRLSDEYISEQVRSYRIRIELEFTQIEPFGRVATSAGESAMNVCQTVLPTYLREYGYASKIPRSITESDYGHQFSSERYRWEARRSMDSDTSDVDIIIGMVSLLQACRDPLSVRHGKSPALWLNHNEDGSMRVQKGEEVRYLYTAFYGIRINHVRELMDMLPLETLAILRGK